MRKSFIVALCSTGAIVIAAGSAAIGFYEGMDFGSKTMGVFSRHSLAEHALFEIRFSLAALGKDDLNLSKQESMLDLREALINLGALSKNDMHVLCSDKDRHALADAGDYLATHADPNLFSTSPYWNSAIKFCDSQHRDPKVTVSYMTTGKE